MTKAEKDAERVALAERIVELHETLVNGRHLSQREIGRAVGKSQGYVYKVLKPRGLGRPTGRRTWTAEEREELVRRALECHDKGMGLVESAEALGVSHTFVRPVWVEHGREIAGLGPPRKYPKPEVRTCANERCPLPSRLFLPASGFAPESTHGRFCSRACWYESDEGRSHTEQFGERMAARFRSELKEHLERTGDLEVGDVIRKLAGDLAPTTIVYYIKQGYLPTHRYEGPWAGPKPYLVKPEDVTPFKQAWAEGARSGNWQRAMWLVAENRARRRTEQRVRTEKRTAADFVAGGHSTEQAEDLERKARRQIWAVELAEAKARSHEIRKHNRGAKPKTELALERRAAYERWAVLLDDSRERDICAGFNDPGEASELKIARHMVTEELELHPDRWPPEKWPRAPDDATALRSRGILTQAAKSALASVKSLQKPGK